MKNECIFDETSTASNLVPPLSIDVDNRIFALHLTDAGNAEALALLYGNFLRYVHGLGWHFWNGSIWVLDNETKVVQAAKKLAKYRQKLIIDKESDQVERKKKLGLAMKLEGSFGIRNCLKIAQSLLPFSCKTEDLDSQHSVLACPNGTLNLEYRYLYTPDPNELITKCTSTPYIETAKAPRFKKFLEEIFVTQGGQPDLELISYIKKALGYSITGKTNERIIFICVGEGANGKTTFFEIMRHVLGSYAGSIPISSILNQKPGSDCGNDIAALQGKRFVTASETGQTQQLNEEKVKLLTGGDSIKCRFLYKEYFDYFPTYKLWLGCNHKPRIKGTDQAIWDRIKIIPFNRRFPKGDPRTDDTLREKLQQESEGILAWLVEGAEEWANKGLTDCVAVSDATKEYRSDEDIFIDFVTECIQADLGGFVSVKDVWIRYNVWARSNGYEEMANTKILGHAMRFHGFNKTIRLNKVRGFNDYKVV